MYYGDYSGARSIQKRIESYKMRFGIEEFDEKECNLKKKRLKAKNEALQREIQILEKKCACLELILKWQSEKLDLVREKRIKEKNRV